MWTTDDVILQAVADVLNVAVSALNPRWIGLVNEANAKAYRDIRSIQLSRGFTDTQLQTWAGGATTQKMLALYWAFVLGGGLHPYDDTWVKKWDVRQDLLKGMIEDPSGTVAEPPAGGVIAGGRLDDTNDRWQMDKRDPVTGTWHNRDPW